jgi:hypothetical protein
MSDPKSEYRRTANQIGELELERRAAIMAGDDRQAEQFDFDLFAAKLRLKRLADKIEWLEQEQHAQAAANALPDSVAALRQEIQKQEQRYDELRRKPVVDRSACDDAELDRLVPHIPMLRQRLALAERMAAR